MAGLAKGLAIIEAFEDAAGQLTVTDAARLTDLTRAAARRCLLTLVDLHYLDHDGKFFRPLPRLLRLGAAYLSSAPIALRTQSILNSARDRLNESVSLAQLDGHSALFIARAEASHIVSTGVRVGARVASFCTGTGRVLLAELPAADLEKHLDTTVFEALTPKTVVTAAATARIVRQARADGFAICDEELELGMRSIAVPVRNGAGRVVAAMSVSVSSARVSVEQLRGTFLSELRDHARLLGHALSLSGDNLNTP